MLYGGIKEKIIKHSERRLNIINNESQMENRVKNYFFIYFMNKLFNENLF